MTFYVLSGNWKWNLKWENDFLCNSWKEESKNCFFMSLLKRRKSKNDFWPLFWKKELKNWLFISFSSFLEKFSRINFSSIFLFTECTLHEFLWMNCVFSFEHKYQAQCFLFTSSSSIGKFIHLSSSGNYDAT